MTVLATARLTIRPWRTEDRPALERMVRDSDMMRYLTNGRAWSDEEVDEILERQARHLSNHGICMGAVELNEGGEVIGMAGLQPLDDGTFELGWWIWKEYWNRGLASEAARCLVEHARRKMGLDRLAAVIDEPNFASRRVAEKLGMRVQGICSARETNANRPDLPIVLYTMDLPPVQTRDCGGSPA